MLYVVCSESYAAGTESFAIFIVLYVVCSESYAVGTVQYTVGTKWSAVSTI